MTDGLNSRSAPRAGEVPANLAGAATPGLPPWHRAIASGGPWLVLGHGGLGRRDGPRGAWTVDLLLAPAAKVRASNAVRRAAGFAATVSAAFNLALIGDLPLGTVIDGRRGIVDAHPGDVHSFRVDLGDAAAPPDARPGVFLTADAALPYIAEVAADARAGRAHPAFVCPLAALVVPARVGFFLAPYLLDARGQYTLVVVVPVVAAPPEVARGAAEDADTGGGAERVTVAPPGRAVQYVVVSTVECCAFYWGSTSDGPARALEGAVQTPSVRAGDPRPAWPAPGLRTPPWVPGTFPDRWADPVATGWPLGEPSRFQLRLHDDLPFAEYPSVLRALSAEGARALVGLRRVGFHTTQAATSAAANRARRALVTWPPVVGESTWTVAGRPGRCALGVAFFAQQLLACTARPALLAGVDRLDVLHRGTRTIVTPRPPDEADEPDGRDRKRRAGNRRVDPIEAPRDNWHPVVRYRPVHRFPGFPTAVRSDPDVDATVERDPDHVDRDATEVLGSGPATPDGTARGSRTDHTPAGKKRKRRRRSSTSDDDRPPEGPPPAPVDFIAFVGLARATVARLTAAASVVPCGARQTPRRRRRPATPVAEGSPEPSGRESEHVDAATSDTPHAVLAPAMAAVFVNAGEGSATAGDGVDPSGFLCLPSPMPDAVEPLPGGVADGAQACTLPITPFASDDLDWRPPPWVFASADPPRGRALWIARFTAPSACDAPAGERPVAYVLEIERAGTGEQIALRVLTTVGRVDPGERPEVWASVARDIALREGPPDAESMGRLGFLLTHARHYAAHGSEDARTRTARLLASGISRAWATRVTRNSPRSLTTG